MAETAENVSQGLPLAIPSDADLSTWQALPRDEQLRRLQAKLTHPDCQAVSTANMSDILGRARAAAKLRRD